MHLNALFSPEFSLASTNHHTSQETSARPISRQRRVRSEAAASHADTQPDPRADGRNSNLTVQKNRCETLMRYVIEAPKSP